MKLINKVEWKTQKKRRRTSSANSKLFARNFLKLNNRQEIRFTSKATSTYFIGFKCFQMLSWEHLQRLEILRIPGTV